MSAVSFSHPLLGPLNISVNPDQVTWAYGLNTVSYPTYGGEVVQILSVYFDDVTISGTVSTYAEMELIYSWFIAYMQFATQGRDHPHHDQHPVTFSYPERNWVFQLWPKSLPNFKYGREIVAPTWSVISAVSELAGAEPNSLSNLIKNASFDTKTADIALFGKATADFGRTGDLTKNPWASPDSDPTKPKDMTVAAWLSKEATQLGDSFGHFLSSYQANATLTLPQFSKLGISKPAPAATGGPNSKPTKQAKGHPVKK